MLDAKPSATEAIRRLIVDSPGVNATKIRTKTGLPFDTVASVLCRLELSGVIHRGVGGHWSSCSPPRTPDPLLQRACDEILREVDKNSFVTRDQMFAASSVSKPIVAAAILVLQDTGAIDSRLLRRPDGLDKNTVQGRLTDTLKDFRHPFTRTEVIRKFPDLPQSHIDSVLRRAVQSGHLAKTAEMYSNSNPAPDRRAASRADVLAAFPESGPISIALIVSKMPTLTSRGVPGIVSDLVSDGLVIRTGRGSYALASAPRLEGAAAAVGLKGQVCAILKQTPNIDYSAQEIARKLKVPHRAQDIRICLNSLHNSRRAERVIKGRYRHSEAKPIISPLPLELTKDAILRLFSPTTLTLTRRQIVDGLPYIPFSSVETALGNMRVSGEILSRRSNIYELPKANAFRSMDPKSAANVILGQLLPHNGFRLTGSVATQSMLDARSFQAGLTHLVEAGQAVLLLNYIISVKPRASLDEGPSALRVLDAAVRHGSVEWAVLHGKLPMTLDNKRTVANLIQRKLLAQQGNITVPADHPSLRTLAAATSAPPKPSKLTVPRSLKPVLATGELAKTTPLEAKVLAYIDRHPQRRKVDIANGLGMGRGTIIRAVDSLVAKILVKHDAGRYRTLSAGKQKLPLHG